MMEEKANYMLNRYEDAIEYDNILISEDNTNIKILNRRTLYFILLGKLEKAVEDLEFILKLEPDWSDVKCQIEQLKKHIELNKLKKKNEEETLSNTISKITDSSLLTNTKQDNVNWFTNKQHLTDLNKLNKIQDQVMEKKEITTIPTQHSEQVEALFEQFSREGNEFFEAEDYENALMSYNYCIKLKVCEKILNKRALTYIKLGLYEDALLDYDSLIRLKHDTLSTIFRQNYCLIKLNDIQTAEFNIDEFLSVCRNEKEKSGFYILKEHITKMKEKRKKEEEKRSSISWTFIGSTPVLNFEQKNDNGEKLINPQAKIEIKSEKMEEQEKERLKTTTELLTREEPKPADIDAETFEAINDLSAAGDKYYERGFYNDAIMYYNQCIEIYPLLIEVRLNRAQAYFQMNRYEDALNDYNILMTQINLDPASLYRYCYCLVKQDELHQAMTCFIKAVKTKIHTFWPLPAKLNLINYFIANKSRMKCDNESYDEFMTAMKEHCNPLKENIGLALSSTVTDSTPVPNIQEESDEEDQLIDMLLEIDIENEKKEELEKEKLETTKKPEKKESSDSVSVDKAVFKKINEIITIGDEYFDKGCYSEAIMNYNDVIEVCPFLEEPRHNRAISYYVTSRYEEALNDYNFLMKEIILDAKSVYNRCYCLVQLDKLEEVITYLHEAMITLVHYQWKFSAMKILVDYIKANKSRFQNNSVLQTQYNEINIEFLNCEEKEKCFKTPPKIKVKNFNTNNKICYCERGPGPSHRTIPLPHPREDYCIQNESDEILPSFSSTYFVPINTTLSDKTTTNESSISQESKNNKQNKQKFIFSSSIASTSKVDTEKPIGDQLHTTESNILVKEDNESLTNNNNNKNNNNNNDENGKEYNLSPKRLRVNSNDDGDKLDPKKSDNFENNAMTSYKFIVNWNSLKNSDPSFKCRAQILRSITANKLTEVIDNKLDGPMLSSIIQCLEKHFCRPEDIELLIDYLLSLNTVYFITEKDKEALSNIFQFLEDQGCNEAPILRALYS